MQITQVAQRRHTTKAFDPDRRLSAADLAAVRILLRNAASSVNSQPWHFVIASSEAGRGMIADTMKSAYAYNEGKVRKASQVIVFCGRKVLDEAYLARGCSHLRNCVYILSFGYKTWIAECSPMTSGHA